MSISVNVKLIPARWYHYISLRNLGWMNDSVVTEFLVARGKMTLYKSWRYFQTHKSIDQLFAIYFNSRHVGHCGFFEITPQQAELRITIGDKSTWGKGVGKAVIQLMLNYASVAGWKKVILHVNPKNTRAVQLYTKLGFQSVGMVLYPSADDQLKMRYDLTHHSIS